MTDWLKVVERRGEKTEEKNDIHTLLKNRTKKKKKEKYVRSSQSVVDERSIDGQNFIGRLTVNS